MNKRLKNILFYIVIIILICISININNDYIILKDRAIIYNDKTLNKYKYYKFVTLNLEESKEERFSIMDNDKLNSNIYTVKYNNKTILVRLNNSTIVTDKVNVMYLNDDLTSNKLKEDIINESNDKIEFNKGYYTNINLKQNEDIIKLKYNLSLILIGVSILFGFINLIFLIVKKE